MVLIGKEEEMRVAREWAQDKLSGPGTLLNGLQVLVYLHVMESATTEEKFRTSKQNLFGIEIDHDPFE